MPAQLTRSTFEPLLGKRFLAHVPDIQPVELELTEAQALPTYPGARGQSLDREPFSLVFRGPKGIVLSQRIYTLDQETLGRVEIFLVPIGPDEIGQRYEAVFN